MRSVSIGRWTALATVDANSLVTAQGVGTAGSPQDEGTVRRKADSDTVRRQCVLRVFLPIAGCGARLA